MKIMKEYRFEVRGMACEMCENHINAALRQCAEIKSIKSDRKKNAVSIIAESLDTGLAAEKIRSLGYEVGTIRESVYEKKSLFSRFKK